MKVAVLCCFIISTASSFFVVMFTKACKLRFDMFGSDASMMAAADMLVEYGTWCYVLPSIIFSVWALGFWFSGMKVALPVISMVVVTVSVCLVLGTLVVWQWQRVPIFHGFEWHLEEF